MSAQDEFDRVEDALPKPGSALPHAREASPIVPAPPQELPPPPDQSPLRFQVHRPATAGHRKDGERAPRPADIDITPTSARLQSTLDPQGSPSALGSVLGQAGRRPSSPFTGAGSPGAPLRSASPRHLSPATSQIFERDVQESASMTSELSPAIPAHIQTEDHIPPVLEASSKAITDEQLDPDDVEIVMHSEHRPAAVTVAAASVSEAPPVTPAMQELHVGLPPSDHEETGSTYGAVDPADPRRLSFISFADVIHAENVEMGKEPSHLVSPASMSTGARSPSPVRSPVPDRTRTSPPVSGANSLKASETSPVRGGPGSTMSGQHLHGELTIETMRQTLQKTGSNEPGVQPNSPI